MFQNANGRFPHMILVCFRLACTGQCLKKSIPTALVVGVVLNSINQLPNLFHHQPVSGLKIGLNFLVPFLVSSYSVVSVLSEAKFDSRPKK